MPQLSKTQLESVVSGVAHMLDNLQIDYAIMGGAATCLLAQDPTRSTEDVDLVIHVDQLGICSRYASNPTPNRDLVLTRIVPYLALRHGPREGTDGNLRGYTDPFYGDCLDTRSWTSGYTCMLWNDSYVVDGGIGEH